ncbi:jasmonate-induced protein homolog [Chenopodium quinoa]|uniref:jasmonate-induced protein homolog n=1 Tax=Chenopodium quinoa TaxID=63459 RepID=UPI000B774A04|nr:jasmonate-induced protein homolog [Chenopodium quinoa]
MASSTQSVVKKEEAALNELMKQAEEAKPQDEMLFGGWIYNRSNTAKKTMHLYAEKTWSGKFYYKYSETLEESTGFTQTGQKEKGIKAAVVYSLKTSDDPFNHYGFLLAWSDSFNEGNHTRKVYGSCGLLEKFQNIDWDKVEKDLDASTSSSSYIDAYTRTSVKAEIVANVVYADFN